MTVLIYVNTSKQVGDVDHIKVFANVDAPETWFDPRGRRVRIRGFAAVGLLYCDTSNEA
jgi:hypothetical protein